MSTKIVQSVFAASVLFMIKEELVKAFIVLTNKSKKVASNLSSWHFYHMKGIISISLGLPLPIVYSLIVGRERWSPHQNNAWSPLAWSAAELLGISQFISRTKELTKFNKHESDFFQQQCYASILFQRIKNQSALCIILEKINRQSLCWAIELRVCWYGKKSSYVTMDKYTTVIDKFSFSSAMSCLCTLCLVDFIVLDWEVERGYRYITQRN